MMAKRKPPTDDTVINLQDVRKRIEAEAKQKGGSVADIFHEMFGHAFGFPGAPYDKALLEQQAEASAKREAAKIQELIKREIIDPLKGQIDRAFNNTERALSAAEQWKAEAERLQEKLADNESNESIEFDPRDIIDEVISTLRRDHRMPNLTLFEWEQLLGSHYGIITIDIELADDAANAEAAE